MTTGHAVNLCVEYDRLMGEAREGRRRVIIQRNINIALAVLLVLVGLSLFAFDVIDFAALLRGSVGILLAAIFAVMQHREARMWLSLIEDES